MYIITNADHKKYIDDLIPAKKLKEMEKLQYSVKIVNEIINFKKSLAAYVSITFDGSLVGRNSGFLPRASGHIQLEQRNYIQDRELQKGIVCCRDPVRLLPGFVATVQARPS